MDRFREIFQRRLNALAPESHVLEAIMREFDLARDEYWEELHQQLRKRFARIARRDG
jgi:hypothetical protein